MIVPFETITGIARSKIFADPLDIAGLMASGDTGGIPVEYSLDLRVGWRTHVPVRSVSVPSTSLTTRAIGCVEKHFLRIMKIPETTLYCTRGRCDPCYHLPRHLKRVSTHSVSSQLDME